MENIQGLTYLKKAIEYFYQNPFFGNGLGSFGYLYRGFDVRDYPHDMLLEVLSELGIFGVVIILVPIILTIIKFFKYVKIENNLFLKVSMHYFYTIY